MPAESLGAASQGKVDRRRVASRYEKGKLPLGAPSKESSVINVGNGVPWQGRWGEEKEHMGV